MARVQSQKIRQAVLTTGDPVDPNTLPEKLQLFNELGEPLMLGGGFARRVDPVSTAAVLDPGQTEQQELEFFPSIRLYKISTNRPARVRLYPSETQRDDDVTRPIGIKPTGNHGRLLELITSADILEYVLSPAVDMTSVDAFDAMFYSTITNLDAVAGAVVVTYNYFRTE